MNYQEIQKLFGTPLQQVPRPHIPYKLKTSHLLWGGVLISLSVIGLVKVVQFINDLFDSDPKKK
jgi:hypothetical protein